MNADPRISGVCGCGLTRIQDLEEREPLPGTQYCIFGGCPAGSGAQFGTGVDL